MSQPAFTFQRNERLKSERTIARLFKEGRSYMAYPVRVVWLPMDENFWTDKNPGGLQSPNFPAQIAFSVPKRAFKTAVARNRIKRQLREAWRLQKHLFYEKLGDRRVALMLVFVAKTELQMPEIASGIRKVIRKFEG